jgi:flagellar protein FlbT
LHEALLRSFSTDEVLVGLMRVRSLVADDRIFDALKAIRALYPVERTILESGISGVAA